MAIAEERKSTLQASRLAGRGLRTAGSAPGAARSPRSRAVGGNRTSEKKSALRASRLKSLALAGSLAFAMPASAQPSSQDRTEQVDAAQEQGQQHAQAMAKAQHVASIRAAAQQRAAQQQMEEEKSGKDDAANAQQALKKKAKAAVRRGMMYLLNLIGAAIDAGSVGITLIITGFIYLFTLGWLNTEMIYGSYFMKGKSKVVGPLSYEPIPVPFDKKAIILVAFVVAANIAFVVALVVLGSFGACFIHDAVKFANSPLQAGSAIAQGGTDLCLGAIIAAAL